MRQIIFIKRIKKVYKKIFSTIQTFFFFYTTINRSELLLHTSRKYTFTKSRKAKHYYYDVWKTINIVKKTKLQRNRNIEYTF